MKTIEQSRLSATIALLRALVLLIAGLFALFAPATALIVVVIVGGCLLIVDGALVLLGQNYAEGRPWPFWLNVTRGGLAILAGLLLLFGPYIVRVVTIEILATVVGLAAILIGLIEMFVIIRGRKQYQSIWAALLGAGLYVVLGLVLLFTPFAGKVLLVQIGGAIVAVVTVVQLIRTWLVIRDSAGVRPVS